MLSSITYYMNYTAKNFQLHYLPSYKLLVKTDFLQDSLMVLNAENELVALYSYPSDSPNGEAMKLLGLPFQQVYINIPLQSMVFVPSDVYEEKDKGLYQTFQLDDNADRTKSLALASLAVTVCYQYDLLLHNRWRKIFPEAKFVSDFQLVLDHVQTHVPMQGIVLGAHFRDVQVDLYCFIDGQFQLYNSFEIASADDLKYFVLNLLQTLGIKNKADKFIYSGIAAQHEFNDIFARFADESIFLAPRTVVACPAEVPVEELEAMNLLLDAPLCV